MAVNIQGIIQNALSDFSGTMAQKESRMNLAQQRRATTQREDTNNFLVTSGVVGLDENGNFNVDLEKAHMQGGDRFINLLNEEAKAGRKFTDVNTGETVTGKFEDLPSAVKVGEGDNAATNYILTITTPDGRKVPVTTGRSNDPSDGPAVLDQSSLELIYESAILNSIGKYGISGTAAGMLENMNFNNSQARAQLQAADALQNEENSQALVSLIGSLGPELKSINPNRGTTKSGLPEVPLDSTPEGTTKPVTTTGGTKGTPDEFYVLDTSQQEVQDALPLINNIQAGQSYSAEEIDQLSKGLSPGFRSAFKKNFSFTNRLLEVNAEKIAELEAKEDKSQKDEIQLNRLKKRRESYLIPQQQKQIDRVRQNIADDTATQQAADAKATEKVQKQLAAKERLLNNPNLSEGRRKEIQTEVDELKGGMTQQDTGENVSFELPEIPTDAEGAAKWFSDPANQATIDQLDQEKVTEVRQLLQKFNINSKEELIDGVKTGKISQNAFRNAAKLISWSIVDKNGQKDPQLSANLYAGMINEAITGSPDVTSTQMANAQTARDRLAFEVKKYYDGLDDERYDSLRNLYEVAGKQGFDSSEFLQNLKPSTTFFLKDKRFEDLTTTDKELMDGILSQALLEAANKAGSDSIADWFGDVFLRGSAGDTLGNTMDNVEIEYDKDPNTNADARPVRLIFTRSRGGSQVEADQSLDWNDVTEIIGQGELTNYLLSRAKRR